MSEPSHGQTMGSQPSTGVNFRVEEYRALRTEIIQNSQEALKILEFGVAIVVALLAFAFTDFINEYRWLFLFVPCLILFPIISLLTQRVQASNRIGHYILEEIESSFGQGWERYRRMRKSRVESERKTMKYIKAITYPFIILQALAISLSLVEIIRFGSDFFGIGYLKLIIWTGLLAITATLVYLEYEAITEVVETDRLLGPTE